MSRLLAPAKVQDLNLSYDPCRNIFFTSGLSQLMFFSFVLTHIFLQPWAYPRADAAHGSFSLGCSKWKLCPTFFVFIDPAWHPFSAVTPVWRWSCLLGGVLSANWPYFLFHPITLSFLSVLSWMATWPQVFVFSAVFIAWNICSGIWIVALFFFKSVSLYAQARGLFLNEP